MDKPPCICKHSHGAHAWGTSFCACYQEPIAGDSTDKLCGCKQYRAGLCDCGHAWEVHGIVDGKDQELVCPFCGKNCKHWDTKPSQLAKFSKLKDERLSPEVNPDWRKSCPCEHVAKDHSLDWSKQVQRHVLECSICKHECSLSEWPQIEMSTSDMIDDECKCGHWFASHQSLKGTCCVGNCQCQKFVSKVFDTRQTWQKELEEEEEDKPDCTCGHGYNSHYEEDDPTKLPCAECWTENPTEDGRVWEFTCKNYQPKLDWSDDPARVNAEANKLLARDEAIKELQKEVGKEKAEKMTPEEIQAKIDEWVAKRNAEKWSTTGQTAQKPPIGQQYGNAQSYQESWWSKCAHKPTHVINGKNWHVWAGTKSECLSTVLDYDVVLNVSNGLSTIPKHIIPFEWAKKYQVISTKEIELDWPDASIPIIPAQFWWDLKEHLKKTRGKMIVFCIGGHGRTGTAVACLLVACGWKAEAAKQWIRRYYCKEAIETKSQEDYIDLVEQKLHARTPKKEKITRNKKNENSK